MKLLEINHCNKKFGENEVLKDISLSVEEGQVVSIIGPSGSGKSTRHAAGNHGRRRFDLSGRICRKGRHGRKIRIQ